MDDVIVVLLLVMFLGGGATTGGPSVVELEPAEPTVRVIELEMLDGACERVMLP